MADAQNCRVLVINANRTVARQIGTDGVCVHHPPASMGSPNGDTPLAGGDLLVSEINGSRVGEYTPAGRLAWTVRLPVSYPSDPQQLGPDRYLIADHASPGQILQFNRAGTILYRYRAASGPGMLDHPSLAELLPSGVFMANDDHNDRMVAIDPATGALIWPYGITGKPGTAPGQLNTPDGFDLLAARRLDADAPGNRIGGSPDLRPFGQARVTNGAEVRDLRCFVKGAMSLPAGRAPGRSVAMSPSFMHSSARKRRHGRYRNPPRGCMPGRPALLPSQAGHGGHHAPARSAARDGPAAVR